MRWPPALLAALVLACAGEPQPARHEKPHPPVELSAVATDLGGGQYEVAIEGVGSGPLELTLLLPDGVEQVGGPRSVRGAGPRERLVARVRGPAGTRVAGHARVAAGGRTASVRLGGPAPVVPAARVVMTPLGPVAESRE